MIKTLLMAFLLMVPVVDATPDPAVVRVSTHQPMTSYHGTGTCVAWDGNTALVLTANHVVNERRVDKYTITFPEMGTYEATLVGQDRVKDLAALTVVVPDTEKPLIPMAEQDPALGDEVMIAGYGSGVKSPYRAFVGKVNETKKYDQGWYTVDTPARSGDSGGPILAGGQLVGVLWGSLAGECYFSPITIVRDFVERLDIPADLKRKALKGSVYDIWEGEP